MMDILSMYLWNKSLIFHKIYPIKIGLLVYISQDIYLSQVEHLKAKELSVNHQEGYWQHNLKALTSETVMKEIFLMVLAG